ncbi:hypothetical protein Q5752_006159 [Cryptotrichosporon argae]
MSPSAPPTPTSPSTPPTPKSCLKNRGMTPPAHCTPALPSPPRTPASPVQITSRPPSPESALAPPPFPPTDDDSLHAPLKLHLRLLHPQTPPTVLSFVARRLLSPERPHGHTGSWSPLAPRALSCDADADADADANADVVADDTDAGAGDVGDGENETRVRGRCFALDLAVAGVGREAADGVEQRGPGKARDQRLAHMYAVARESYRVLELKCPGVDKL